MKINRLNKQWLFVGTVMVIAAIIRFRFNTGINYLLIGSDGPYYPLQVRSLLENARLAFPDMPLVFIMEACVAQILQWLRLASFEDSIMLAVKYMDVVLPPLAAIPVYWIAQSLLPTSSSQVSRWGLLVVVFSVLNYATVFAFMVSGLQKNAMAIIWVFFYLYYLIQLLKKASKPDFYKAVISLILCFLTHFGCFSLILAFTGLLGVFMLVFLPRKVRIGYLRPSLIVVLGCLELVAILLWLDPQRLERLISIPFKIFEAPMILCLFDGGFSLDPISILHGVLYNGLAVLAFCILAYYRNELEVWQKVLASTLLVFSLFLCSPLIGLEWWKRLCFAAFIPITVLYLLVFQIIRVQWLRFFAAMPIGLLMLIALRLSQEQRSTSMSGEAYSAFKTMPETLNMPPNAVILGRQDIRLLGSWFFRRNSYADYLFEKEDFEKYEAVYIFKQLAGSNLNESRFKERPLPLNTTLVAKNDYFELYQILDGSQWQEGNGKPMIRAKGRIVSIADNRMVVQNEETGKIKTIYTTAKTRIALLNGRMEIVEGMSVDVWAKMKVFSLALEASALCEMP